VIHGFRRFIRSRGISSRYVSGYVCSASGQSMRADQATHAWVECLLPNRQWRGFDPTNDLLVNDQYIKILRGRDCADVPAPAASTAVRQVMRCWVRCR
jgi:transglutaminase-like putative cysteine protease